MAKKTNLQQPPIFKKDIPEMPEGYYSSGPNPNLAKFVEEHTTPYDPETDDYNVPPFDKPITTTKATAIYNMHTYWSKKPHDAIQEYIKHYTKPGDLVLDPFCGSGGTALAALMEGRKAIAIDLSPAATFITKNYCTPVDTDALQQAFNELEAAVKDEMEWLYETRCDRCDGKAKTNYTVWSYVFECPRCLRKIPLFDCPEAQIPKADGKGTKKANICPFCYKEGHNEEIKAGKTNRFDPIPVQISYECLDGCKPKKDKRYYLDKNQKKREYFQKYDIGKINEIETIEIPYWYPPNRMMNVESETEPWGDEWREGRNFRRVADLYTKRNLWALAAFKNNIDGNKKFIDNLLFLLSSLILNLSIMTTNRDRLGFLKGTYYIPQVFRVTNVLSSLKNKNSQLKNGYQFIKLIKEKNISISTQSCLSLEKINDNSIDFIFTDPPYSGKVQYGELNFIWEAWLGFNTEWHDEEIIVNQTRGKTEEDWAEMMRLALEECYRSLKPGRWISLCYHDTSEGTWQLIQDIMAEIGFISEDIEQTLYIDAGQKSYNQKIGEKVTKRDLVINFRKPRFGETKADITFTGIENQLSFQDKAKKIFAEILERSPGNTSDKIYDELVSRMVRKGEFERHDFIALLRSVAEEVLVPNEHGKLISRWYILETVETVDEAESKKEDAAANRLETFMSKFLNEYPENEGVHYSDLFEQYLPIKEKPRRLLIDWLPEYFYRTFDSTWRPPMDEEERQQKNSLRSSGSLRRIKRFTNAILNSVPPAENDRPENAATLADWIYQCRRAGLFEQGKLLYERGGLSFENLSDEAQLAVKEDYEICLKRREPEKEIKKSQPKLL